MHGFVEFVGAGQIYAERLFDDDTPRTFSLGSQACLAEVLDGLPVELRSRRQVVNPRTRFTLFDLIEKTSKLDKIIELPNVAGQVVNPLSKLGPFFFVETFTGKFFSGLCQFFSPLCVRKFGTRHSDYVE
jgi:hypothetical protein